MSTYVTTKYWIPRYNDAGINSTISSIADQQLEIADFMTELNTSIDPDMNQSMFLQYLSDVQNVDELTEIYVEGAVLPNPNSRADAPEGLGQDASSVWFTTPDTGIKTVSWFVNGSLVIERQQDLSTNRGATKTELGVSASDVVQVGIIENNIAGWWGRITIT